MKAQRLPHLKMISSVARLIGYDVMSAYKLLADGEILQALCLEDFPQVEGFAKLSQISKHNREVLQKGCSDNNRMSIEEELEREKVQRINEGCMPQYVYLSEELSSSGWTEGAGNITEKKWKDSWVTSAAVPISFETWVVELSDRTQLVGLSNISAEGYGDLISFKLGTPRINENMFPELFDNACVSIEHLEGFLEEEIDDRYWEDYWSSDAEPESDDSYFSLRRRKDNIATVILHFGNELSKTLGRVATASELWSYIYDQSLNYKPHDLEYWINGEEKPLSSLSPEQLRDPEIRLSVDREQPYTSLHNFKRRVSNATAGSGNKRGRAKGTG